MPKIELRHIINIFVLQLSVSLMLTAVSHTEFYQSSATSLSSDPVGRPVAILQKLAT